MHGRLPPAFVGLVALAIGGCGEAAPDLLGATTLALEGSTDIWVEWPDKGDLKRVRPLSKIGVNGVGSVDFERIYMPSVVLCEHGNANNDTIYRAQAIAARSWALQRLHTDLSGTGMGDSEKYQVFTCGPGQYVVKALEACSSWMERGDIDGCDLTNPRSWPGWPKTAKDPPGYAKHAIRIARVVAETRGQVLVYPRDEDVEEDGYWLIASFFAAGAALGQWMENEDWRECRPLTQEEDQKWQADCKAAGKDWDYCNDEVDITYNGGRSGPQCGHYCGWQERDDPERDCVCPSSINLPRFDGKSLPLEQRELSVSNRGAMSQNGSLCLVELDPEISVLEVLRYYYGDDATIVGLDGVAIDVTPDPPFNDPERALGWIGDPCEPTDEYACTVGYDRSSDTAVWMGVCDTVTSIPERDDEGEVVVKDGNPVLETHHFCTHAPGLMKKRGFFDEVVGERLYFVPHSKRLAAVEEDQDLLTCDGLCPDLWWDGKDFTAAITSPGGELVYGTNSYCAAPCREYCRRFDFNGDVKTFCPGDGRYQDVLDQGYAPHGPRDGWFCSRGGTKGRCYARANDWRFPDTDGCPSPLRDLGVNRPDPNHQTRRRTCVPADEFQDAAASALGKADADGANVLAAGPEDDRPNPEYMDQGGCGLTGTAPRPAPWLLLLFVSAVLARRRRG